MKLSRALVVIDLETTGTWVDRDKIVEIAMIKSIPDLSPSAARPEGLLTSASGGQAAEKMIYAKRVNPGLPIPPLVSQLINITDEDVKDAPAFKDIAQEVLDFIGDSDLAGFNIEKFDLPLLEREVREANLSFNWKERRVYDAQKVYHLNEKRDLYAAYKFYCDKSLDNAHSAVSDAQATLEILDAQAHKYGDAERSLESLEQYRYKNLDEFYDKEKRFRWWDGKLYMMFGKYAKRYTLQEIVQKDRRYLEWILTAQFSDDVKDLIENALQGRFPQPPQNRICCEAK